MISTLRNEEWIVNDCGASRLGGAGASSNS